MKEFPASKFTGEAKELNEKSRDHLQRLIDKNKDVVEKESKRVILKTDGL